MNMYMTPTGFHWCIPQWEPYRVPKDTFFFCFKVYAFGFMNPKAYTKSKGYLKIVQLLIKEPRLDIYTPDIYGYTLFYEACINDNFEIIQLLIPNHRLDINISNQYVQDSRKLSISFVNMEVSKVLIYF